MARSSPRRIIVLVTIACTALLALFLSQRGPSLGGRGVVHGDYEVEELNESLQVPAASKEDEWEDDETQTAAAFSSEKFFQFRPWRIRRRHLQGQSSDDNTIDESDALSITIDFDDIYNTVIFITVVWIMGYLSERLGMPSLVGEICAGFLLGPPLADFVPYPEALVLIGNFGLVGLILQSGIEIDVSQLKDTGLRAIAMAFVGSAIPLAVGLGLGIAAGLDLKSAVAIGAVFSPSSLGVAANVLSAGEVMNTPIGQLIVASSVVDDVLGLILLSILEVLVKVDPKPFDFVLPFIASFGYLFVLGYAGLTVIPRTIEHKIMPRFSENYREFVAFALMFLLLILYLPLLDYSGASYLTGAFLAGLSFSQIHSVHVSFIQNGRQVLNWLLRIFFAATIGFQVPIKNFQDPYVLKWGAKFLTCVVAKGILGFFVPRGEHKLPDDFPYDPYWRDVTITSLAVMCRGEFNFIIASFALGVGLIGPDLYSAVVFAILIAAIFGPLLLSKAIQYYNAKSKLYLASSHPIQRDGNTCDGLRPLFLAVQTRTPIHWGLQGAFKKALEKAGVIVIDHRYWHTLGLDAADITELFVQDTKVKIKVRNCFANTLREAASLDKLVAQKNGAPSNVTSESSVYSTVEDGVTEAQEIQDRCDEIKQALTECLLSDDPEDYVIQVAQWEAYTFDSKAPDAENARERTSSFYCFHNGESFDENSSPFAGMPDVDDGVVADLGDVPRLSFRSEETEVDHHQHEHQEEPHLSTPDLWEEDPISHDMARDGYYMVTDQSGHYDVTVGTEAEEDHGRGARHRRSVTFDASQLETMAIRERLHGYVRPAQQF